MATSGVGQRRSDGASVQVFILAGGKSRRMGVDKASLRVSGTPLISRVATAVHHLGRLHIVGGDPGLVELVRSTSSVADRPSHIPDDQDDPGPFVALVTALSNLQAETAVAVSCDLATITVDDIELLTRSLRGSTADYAVPLVGGRRQWHGLALKQHIVPTLTEMLCQGARSFHAGFGGLSECAVVSASASFFSDVDTPQDLDALQDG